jgi:hypothetical protein
MPFLAAVAVLPWVAVCLTEFNPSSSELLSSAWRLIINILRKSNLINSISSGRFVAFFLLTCLAIFCVSIGLWFIHAYRPQSKFKMMPQPSKEDSSKHNQVAFLWKCLLPICLATLFWTLAWQWYNQWAVHIPWNWYNDWPKTYWISSNMFLFATGGFIIHVLAYLLVIISWLKDRLKSMQSASDVVKQTSWYKIPWSLLIIILTGAVRPFLKVIRDVVKQTSWYKIPWSLLKVILTGPVGGLLIVILTGAVGGLLIHFISLLLIHKAVSSTLYTCLAFPGILLSLLLSGYAFEGVASRFMKDEEREWLARYNAWIVIVAIGWLTVTGIVLYGPVWIVELKHRITVAGIGVISGFITALLGQSKKTAGDGAGSRRGKGNASGILGLLYQFALPIAAVLTMVSLMIILSFLDMTIIRALASISDYTVPDMKNLDVLKVAKIPFWVPTLVLVGLVVVGLIMARSINTNRFSLHAMYRARLIRTYLGASRVPKRKGDPFTGFDEEDNLDMCKLRYDKDDERLRPPFHIINVALNLVAGQNLAWQERKASSFSISALHAGTRDLGYRITSLEEDKADATKRIYGGEKGISLGTAMTISGAAASPNMGYHSSPAIAFMMTLFNIRLGWWLGNPGESGKHSFYRDVPKWAVKPIFDELLGNTDDKNDYVYLSDGGHFENLGLYEMVLRRNRFIVVSDAGCDQTCTLDDLGNAIRKIRIDLGIPIEFSTDFKNRARSSDPQVPKGQYWAFGRILYSHIDSKDREPDPAYDGLLLYIKPGVYGGEPQDVYNYATANKEFPHESTSDQFFNESQFESYRALGQYAIKSIESELGRLGTSLECLFDENERKKILDDWHLGVSPLLAIQNKWYNIFK